MLKKKDEESAKCKLQSTSELLSNLLIIGLLLFGSNAYGVETQRSLVPVMCESIAGERQHCTANTSAGVLMAQSTGASACLLGKSWGYDDAGVWVQDGCSGEFLVSQAPPSAPLPGTPAAVVVSKPKGEAADIPPQAPQEQPVATVADQPNAASSAAAPAKHPQQPATAVAAQSDLEPQVITSSTTAPAPSALQPTDASTSPYEPNPTWGTFTPGDGFLVGRTELGELSISGYAMLRYMNQMPSSGTYNDHLGNEHYYDGRHDIFSHRILVWLKGWMGDPKLRYNIAFWTVNTTDQDALFGNIGYQFNKKFNLYAGINGNPGVRSTQGSHPYWLGHDRVMADEFFRPFFSQGIWANGELFPGFWYNAMIGNNSSILGTKATDLDRKFTHGASVWWMPTTHEFGPRGGYGDFAYHDELATRFGISTTFSTEQRYNDEPDDPQNTSLKLADGLNLFGTGSLAPDVTVTEADYRILSIDAGFKYKGFFLQTEYFYRWLDNFVADGVLPDDEITDHGFYVQAAFFPIPKKLELYAATSQIFGDKDAGFGNSSDYLIGLNYYPWDTRNHRLNLQINNVDSSPVGSTFGYYTAGQTGTTVSTAFSVFF